MESLHSALEDTVDPSSLFRDVWRAFLMAMLFFLISEALLCLPKKSHPQVLPQRTTALKSLFLFPFPYSSQNPGCRYPESQQSQVPGDLLDELI
jgi:hypothetical protein